MDVSILLPGNLESLKIEEWYFGVSKASRSSNTSSRGEPSAHLTELQRMIKCISPEKIYAHNNIIHTDFTFTTDQQTLSTLDS